MTRLAAYCRSFILKCAFLIIDVFAICFSQHADHAIIEGSVTNANDRSPIIGATLMIEGTVLGASTDVNGYFKIVNVPEGIRRVSVSSIGFERDKKEVSVHKGKTYRVDFVLHEKAFQAEEVTITASRRPQSLEEVPVSISIMDGREIEKRTISSLDQALRYIPGVNMTESQVNVRGSSGYSRALGTRVLVLIDGIPLLTGDSGEIKFDAVPMYSIDRIEVVKGAGSALYGSNALGGVINVITKTPRENYTRARVYSGFYDSPYYSEWKWWSNGLRVFNGIDVQRAGVMEKFSYLVSGGVRNNSGYRLNDDDVRWNVNAKSWFELSSLSNLNVAVNYTNDDHGNWIFWRDVKNALIPPASSDISEQIISKKLQAAAQYRQTVDDDFVFLVKAQYYRTAYDTKSDTSDFSFRPLDRVQSTANAFNMEAQGSYLATRQHFLTFGVDGNYSTIDANTYGKRNANYIALYVQDDYKIARGVNLTLGLRGDLTKIDTTKSDGRINPRVGVAWNVSDGSTLRASFGAGFRSPSVAEKFARAAAAGFTTKPNPNLKSERSLSYELGVKHEVNSTASIDAAFFQSDYDDLIEPIIDPADGKITFENISKARIRGFELGIQSGWFERLLQLNVGYTFIYPEDVTLNKILKYRPRHLLYVNGALSYSDARIEVDFRYISRIEEIDDAIGIIVRDADKRVETFVTDIRLSYDFLSLSLPLRAILSVNNPFNYNYAEIVGNLSPIRNYTLTVETKF